MGILLGIGNIEKVSFDEQSQELTIAYFDGHREAVSLSSLSNECKTALEAEIRERTSSDESIIASISAEVNRAKAAEASNTSLTNAETARAKGEEGYLKAAIASKADKSEVVAEANRAQKTETSLFNQIQEEADRAMAAEQANADEIAKMPALVTAEATTRQAEDAKLESAIVAEVERAKEAERVIKNNIVTDVRRENGQSLVVNGIATIPEGGGGGETNLNLENGPNDGTIAAKGGGNTFASWAKYSFAFGRWNTINSSNAIAVGLYNTLGSSSFAFGNYLETKNANEMAIGGYNSSIDSFNEDLATAFSIGRGTSEENRKNIFEVKQSGLVVIGKSGSVAEGNTYAVTGNEVWEALQSVQPSTQVQADWNEEDETSTSYIANKPELSAVAKSGSYNDLEDKPSIPSTDNLLTKNTEQVVSASKYVEKDLYIRSLIKEDTYVVFARDTYERARVRANTSTGGLYIVCKDNYGQDDQYIVNLGTDSSLLSFYIKNENGGYNLGPRITENPSYSASSSDLITGKKLKEILDSEFTGDFAHLSGNETFTGQKTFTVKRNREGMNDLLLHFEIEQYSNYNFDKVCINSTLGEYSFFRRSNGNVYVGYSSDFGVYENSKYLVTGSAVYDWCNENLLNAYEYFGGTEITRAYTEDTFQLENNKIYDFKGLFDIDKVCLLPSSSTNFLITIYYKKYNSDNRIVIKEGNTDKFTFTQNGKIELRCFDGNWSAYFTPEYSN